MQNLETVEKSRRIFLNRSVIAGVAAFLGLSYFKRVDSNSQETVKMLTSDGKLVEIERKYLPDKRGKKISNRELLEWKSKCKSISENLNL